MYGIDTAAVLEALGQHLALTLSSLVMAIVIGLPLGIYLAREKFLAGPTLAVLSTIQTIPSVALLGFLIPLLGIGAKPAILALFIYALLPIVRNAFTGISQVDPSAIEAARGIGMTERQILMRVMLPQSLPILMAGVRTSTVLNVSVATLAALIGAGGLGTFIFRGISMVNTPMILAGAIPTALLAVALDALLAFAERGLTPRGLRKAA
ncbi:MAG: ABC transporter permease [Polyangiales bacterium]